MKGVVTDCEAMTRRKNTCRAHYMNLKLVKGCGTCFGFQYPRQPKPSFPRYYYYYPYSKGYHSSFLTSSPLAYSDISYHSTGFPVPDVTAKQYIYMLVCWFFQLLPVLVPRPKGSDLPVSPWVHSSGLFIPSVKTLQRPSYKGTVLNSISQAVIRFLRWTGFLGDVPPLACRTSVSQGETGQLTVCRCRVGTHVGVRLPSYTARRLTCLVHLV